MFSLTPQTERMIDETLKNGSYQSADELVQAALRALNERDTGALDEETLDAIDEAEDAIERGEVHNWEDVKDEIQAMLKNRRTESTTG